MNSTNEITGESRDQLQGWMLDKFGPLMTIAEVAGMFHISNESFRNTLHGSSDPNVKRLRASKVRLGRRVRFPTVAVVDTIAPIEAEQTSE